MCCRNTITFDWLQQTPIIKDHSSQIRKADIFTSKITVINVNESEILEYKFYLKPLK